MSKAPKHSDPSPHEVSVKFEYIDYSASDEHNPLNSTYELNIAFENGKIIHGNKELFDGLLEDVFNLAEAEVQKITHAGKLGVLFRLNVVECCSKSVATDEIGIRNFETTHHIKISVSNQTEWPDKVVFNHYEIANAHTALKALDRQLTQAAQRIARKLPKIIATHTAPS